MRSLGSRVQDPDLETFDRIGGINAFVKWVNDSECPENKKEFYKICSRLTSPMFDFDPSVNDPVDSDDL